MTRPSLLLAVLVAYLALAFGLRTYLHWRRTGSTGFRGISGAPFSAAWLGGVLFIVALVGTVAAPILVIAGVESTVVGPSRFVDVVAAIALVAGCGLLVWSQGFMGASWRIGVDGAERTDLVTGGPFGLVRNPIFSGMLLSAAGFAMILPTVTAIASFSLLVVAIELQVRAVEEPYLLRTHGESYASYAARTGRLVPWLGLIRHP